jgi:hypothetical protein
MKYSLPWTANLNEVDSMTGGEFMLSSYKQKAKSYSKDMETSKATFAKALFILYYEANSALRGSDKVALREALIKLNKLTLLWISKL